MSIAKDVTSAEAMEKLVISAIEAYREDPIANQSFLQEVLHAYRTHSWAVERVLKLLEVQSPDLIESINKSITSLADNSVDEVTASTADWGAGKSLFMYGIVTAINFGTNQPFIKHEKAVWLLFGDAGLIERYAYVTLEKAVKYGTGWRLYHTHYFPVPIKIQREKTLNLRAINASGVTITSINFWVLGYVQ